MYFDLKVIECWLRELLYLHYNYVPFLCECLLRMNRSVRSVLMNELQGQGLRGDSSFGFCLAQSWIGECLRGFYFLELVGFGSDLIEGLGKLMVFYIVMV